jgi:hypothetical protein
LEEPEVQQAEVRNEKIGGTKIGKSKLVCNLGIADFFMLPKMPEE